MYRMVFRVRNCYLKIRLVVLLQQEAVAMQNLFVSWMVLQRAIKQKVSELSFLQRTIHHQKCQIGLHNFRYDFWFVITVHFSVNNGLKIETYCIICSYFWLRPYILVSLIISFSCFVLCFSKLNVLIPN